MEAGMKFFAQYPYVKSTGFSLVLHGVLIGFFLLLGGSAPSVALPGEIVAIEVEIIPDVVVDMRDTASVSVVPRLSAPVSTVPSLLADRAEKPAQTQISTAINFESLSPAMPGEKGETSVVASAGSGVGSGTSGTTGTSGTLGGAAVASGGESRDGGGQTTAASILYAPKPAYPQTARKARWEGAVVVHVLIDADGTVTAVSVREGSDHDVLDEAALNTLKKWRFSSATTDGVPVTSVRDIRVRFRLEDEE